MRKAFDEFCVELGNAVLRLLTKRSG